MEAKTSPVKRQTSVKPSPNKKRKTDVDNSPVNAGNVLAAVKCNAELNCAIFNECFQNVCKSQSGEFQLFQESITENVNIQDRILNFVNEIKHQEIKILIFKLPNSSTIIAATANSTTCTQSYVMDLLETLVSTYNLKIQGLKITFEKQKLSKPASSNNNFTFWEEVLQNAQLNLTLPKIASRSFAQISSVKESTSATLTEHLENFAKISTIPISILFLSSFQALLTRYGCQEHFFFQSFIHRLTKNPIYSPSKISQDENFLEITKKMRDYITKTQPYSEIPVSLVKSTFLNKTEEKPFTVGFVYNCCLPNLFSWIQIPKVEDNCSLRITVSERSSGHEIVVTCNENERFDLDLSRMTKHFINLTGNLVSAPDEKICLQQFLTSEELECFHTWNSTESEFEADRCIHELFEAEAKKSPQKTALVHGDETISYEILNRRADGLVNYLQKIKRNSAIIGVYMEKSIEMITCFISILKSGMAYLPLDPSLPETRILDFIEDSSPDLILTTSKLAEKLPGNIKSFLIDQFIFDEQLLPTSAKINMDTPAYVLFTSGTTGKPKSVVIRHKNAAALVLSMKQFFPQRDIEVILLAASQNFCLFHGLLYHTLSTGNMGIISKSLLHVSEIPDKDKITLIATAPAGLQELINSGQLPTSLRTVILGGDVIPTKLVQNIRESSSNVSVYSSHGCTEATLFDLGTKIPEKIPDRLPVGSPFSNFKVYITDENSQRVPLGFSGELCLSGPQIVNGYEHLPEINKIKFVKNPFEVNEDYGTMFKTGDFARWTDDGFVEILGRMDHMVKINGIRIELEEISRNLLQEKSVREAVVRVYEKNSQKILTAYFVSDHKTVTSIQLQKFLRSKLPYYMVPKCYIRVSKIPRNPNGKIDVASLPAPEFENKQVSSKDISNSEMETKVLNLIEKLLDKSLTKFDNLLQLGLDSIIATQLAIKLTNIFKTEIPTSAVFENANAFELCKFINDSMSGIEPSCSNQDELISLNDDIKPGNSIKLDLNSLNNPSYIFLTGATGFLGAFILNELFTQTKTHALCLVRAENEESGKLRIKQTLNEYQLWQEDFSNRITAIAGDLNEEKLGMNFENYNKLASISDSVYHCAANVNFTLPYSVLRKDAVQATEQIIAFSFAMKIKPLYFMSSIAVHGTPTGRTRLTIINENDFPNSPPSFGYARMKWVSEKLVRLAADRGLPVMIYRPSFVGSHIKTGSMSIKEYITRFIKGCIEIGSYPDANLPLWLVPVDFVSKLTVQTSLQAESLGKTFHLTPKSDVTMSQLMGLIGETGYNLRKEEPINWVSNLRAYCQENENCSLYPLLQFTCDEISVNRSLKAMVEFSTSNVEAVLGKTGIARPRVGIESVKLMVDYLVKRNFLPPYEECF